MSSRRLRHRRSPFTGIMPPRPARTRPADINYRQLIEQQPAVSYVRTHTADRSSHDVSYVSPHVLILLGYPPDAFYADPGLWLSIIDPDDIARVNEELAHSEHNGAPCSTEYRVLTSDGRTIWVRNHAVLIRDWRGQPQGWHGLLVDISNQKHRERQLVEHSLLDPLTSLPNRTLFLSRLDHALQRARRTRAQVILLFLDLDNFKLINDRFGHDQGDQVLITIAQRIATILRGSDSMTRFGGDEFLVLLDDVTDDAQVEQIVARIQHTLSMPITLANGDVQVTASIGIAACATPIWPCIG